MTPPTDEARANPDPVWDDIYGDEARAGEPRTVAGRDYLDELHGKGRPADGLTDYYNATERRSYDHDTDRILAIEREAMSLECDAWLAEGYHRSAAPALDPDVLAEAMLEQHVTLQPNAKPMSATLIGEMARDLMRRYTRLHSEKGGSL